MTTATDTTITDTTPVQGADASPVVTETLAQLKAKADEVKAAAKAAKAAAAEAAKIAAKEAKEAAKAAKANETDAEKAAKAQAKLNKAAADEASKKAAAEAKEASKTAMQNGIRRPKAGTICGNVWALSDDLSFKTGAPALIADLLKLPALALVSSSTVKTQYALWRKFNGVTGRSSASVVTPEVPAAPAGQLEVVETADSTEGQAV
jgi:hypothetical protein